MPNNFVNFKQGTFAAYAALENKDVNTLYFLTDTHEIMKGEVNYSASVIFANEAPTPEDAIPNKLYVVNDKILTYTTVIEIVTEPVDPSQPDGPTHEVEKEVIKEITIYDPKAPKPGTTFEGPVILPSDPPTEDNQAVTKKYVDEKIIAADAMRYRGTLGEGGTITAIPTDNVRSGDTYKVITASEYAGHVCEIGDMIIALEDIETGSTDENWTVVQANIDGAVTGPVSAVAENIAVFDGATGKVIKDSEKKIGGAEFEETTSDATIATEAGVAAYVTANKPVWVQI